MDFAVAVESAGTPGQDRAAVFPFGDGHLIVLADGAGGSAGGAQAADAVIELTRSLEPEARHDWQQVLRQVDARLAADPLLGETTAVLAFVSDRWIAGASVGDSEAWSLLGGRAFELTGRQRRKPLLGSGHAFPVGFGPAPAGERLLVASDGLFKYAPWDVVQRLALLAPKEAVRELVNAARLANSRLQDDVAVVIGA